MNISDLKKIELEITSNCNASCPGCARTQWSDLLEINSITINDLIKAFPNKSYIEGKNFKFCGVLGDPIINPDCMAMIKYLVANNGWCQISTNGGLQTAEWWRELGKLSKETQLVDVSFCVDGHRETNHIYRVNTKFDTIERNMKAYSEGGDGFASASWIFIVFDHNEHELEIAKTHALQLGFKFSIRTGMRNSLSNWISAIKKRNKETKKLENEIKVITTTGDKEHSAKEEVLKIDKVLNKFNSIVLNQPEKNQESKIINEVSNNQKENSEQKEIIEELRQYSNTITCKFVHEGEIFIASNFTLWPCCFLWDSWFTNKDNIKDKLSKYDSDWNSLKKNSIQEILNHPWFNEVLQLSWDPTHNQHLNRCVRTCSLNKAYHNEIKVIAQPDEIKEVPQLENKEVEDIKTVNNLSCNHLDNHLAIVSVEGRISPCCQFEDDRKFKDQETIWKIKNLNKNILKSSFWNNIRKDLDSNKKIVSCESCWKVEQNGGISRRKWINDTTEKSNKIQLEDIEIGLDYTCNMMCRICKPSQSSKWNISTVARDMYARRPAIYKNVLNGKEYQNKILEVLDNTYLGNLKRIRLVGGEPFYSKNLNWFINKIHNEVNIHELSLFVNSNGSIIPNDDILEKILKIKEVNIDFSIDAIGELASTTRWGVLWEIIEENINKWINLSEKYVNIKLSIHSTLSILNVNKVQELINFCDTKNLSFGFSVLNNPDFLDFRQLPLYERLGWQVQSNKQNEFCINDTNKAITSSTVVSNKLRDFLYFNEKIDNYQQRKFEKVNPEIFTLIKKYIK